MKENNIELRTIKSLEGIDFHIPEYQRGYRWKSRQVLDLLEDINEFMDSNENGKYCLQPLVVKQRKPDKEILNNIKNANDILEVKNLLREQWIVIDGQQRLTTIYIILKFFKNKIPFNISYETRKGSKNFLEQIQNNKSNQDYIDFTYMRNTYNVVEKWFKDKKDDFKSDFLRTILYNTEFIWYESVGDEIEVFTRINIGKISLTNAELVKALLLNNSNYIEGVAPTLNEAAIVWDQIEYTLQNDQFWCFIHEKGYNHPTRIDFLLEIIEKYKNPKEDQSPKMNKHDEDNFWYVEKKEMGNDSYITFRYFYQLLLKKECKKRFHLVWNEIVELFSLFKEWYNDNECYHYIGFLTTMQQKNKKQIIDLLINLISKWKGEKKSFVDKLKDDVKKQINNDVKNLNYQYKYDEQEKAHPKTECFPLLLLFNVQTTVEKNNRFKESKNFNAISFERFPFDLFKKEKGWDIEHIASNTENSLDSPEERNEWLESAKDSVAPELTTEIENYLKNHSKKDNQDTDDEEFNSLRNKIEEKESNLNSKDKNKVWNFCLLDQSTNRGYGNSIFSTKRKWILNREKGLVVNDLCIEKEKQVFILPCTLRVFTKFYTSCASDLSVWSKDDAFAYKEAIYEILKIFGITK